jgi:autotransporter-associated beta strand protein
MHSRAKFGLLLGLVAAACFETRAQTYIWTGLGADNNFLTPANWTTNTVPPGSGTDVLAFTARANPASPQSNTVWLYGISNPFNISSIVFNGSNPLYTFMTESAVLGIGTGGITISNTGSGSVTFSSGIGLKLTGNQVWTTASDLWVNGSITGNYNLIKVGTGQLILGSVNSGFTGNLTVAQGTLVLNSANSAGTGNLILQNGTTLAPYNNPLSIPNNVTVSDNVTFAKALDFGSLSQNTPDTTIAGSFTAAVASVRLHVLNDVTLWLSGTLTGPSGTALTFDSGGTTILAGSTNSTISSVTADASGVVFVAPNALPAVGSSVQAVNGGYIGVGATSLVAANVPSPTALLGLITNKAAFNGTFGFDTAPTLGASYTYTDALDFSGFSPTTFKIGSASSAVLGAAAVITPAANAYRFGGGGGLLRVESNLSDNGVTPRTLTVTSPAGEELTLWLAGTNNFTGGITIDNSLLRFATSGALSSTGNIAVPSTSRGGYLGFDYDPGTTAGTINLTTLGGRIVPGGGPLVLGFDSTSLVAPRTITAPIDLSTFPTNTILGTATNVTLNGPNSASLTPAGSPSAPYRFAAIDHGSLTVATQLAGTRGVEIGIANTGTNFSPGTDNGPNNVTLANASNTYSGGTTIFDGVLHLTTSSTSSAGTILFGPLGTGPVTIASTATNVGLQPDSSGGPASTFTLDNPITLNANVSVGDNNFGNTLVLNGAISGPAGLDIIGKLTLTAANTYAGGTDVSSNASVIVNTNTGFGPGNVEFGDGAIVTFTTAAPIIGSLDGGCSAAGIVLPANATSLTINQTIGGTFYGNITGPASGTTTAALVKNGFAGLVLAGTNNYSGGTTINGGKLVADSSNALGTGTVTINGGSLGLQDNAVILNSISFGAGGGTLGGNGTIGSNITVGSNIKLAPGNSPGSLTFTGNLTWAPSGSYNFEIVSATGNVPGSSYDTIVVTSTGSFAVTANSGGKFNLNLISLSSPSSAGNVVDFNSSTNYSWQIASSTNAITGFTPGAFNLDTTGFTNPLSGGLFNVSLGGPGGNTALFLNFTPVPEPSTWALMIVGTGAVLLPALRRRRS